MTEDTTYDHLLQTLKDSACSIFNDDSIGQILITILEEEGCEDTGDVMDNLDSFENSAMIPLIIEQCTAYSSDPSFPYTVYDLFVRIFRDKMVNIPDIVALFVIPNSLDQCTNAHLLRICHSVVQSLNKTEKWTKKPIDGQNAHSLFLDKKLDGESMHKMTPKEFINIAKQYGIKMPKGRALFNGIKEFMDHQNTDNVRIPTKSALMELNNQHIDSNDAQWSDIKELADCGTAQIMEIAERVIAENEKLKNHSDSFLSFLAEKKVDGEMLMKYQKKQFQKEIVAFFDNKKLTGPSGKFLKELKDFDVTTMRSDSDSESDSLQWDKVSALEDCEHIHLMFLTKEIMECRFTNEADKPWKSNPEIDNLIISFLENKEMNGSMVKEYDRKQFGKDAVAFSDGNKKVNGTAMKLYKRLMTMDDENMKLFKETILCASSGVQNEVCSTSRKKILSIFQVFSVLQDVSKKFN